MRIMIVDDTASARFFVVALLQRLGIENVIQVENGSQALSRLRSDKKFDLIFMDWKMPVMTGPEAVSVLKFQGIQIPIVMMTARNTAHDVERMIKLGVKEYMLKPFTLDVLAEKINLATGQKINHSKGSVVASIKAKEKLSMT